MSLYNQLFGTNEDAPALLGMLGVNKEFFDRFRDVFLCNDGNSIKVYTRTGGENREEHQKSWEKIRNHNLYIRDYDDDFDETYAYIEFNIPEKYKKTAKKMFRGEPITINEKFKKECEEMFVPGSDAYKRAEKIAEQIMGAIDNKNDGGIHIIKL